MLAYRHAFHAGNHADVLKHVVLLRVLRHLAEKDKPYTYVDTHAGAGGYSLQGDHANKTGEHAGGIDRLWSAPDLPAALADYVALVRAFNGGRTLEQYPGSPAFAHLAARPTDRLRLYELHPTDHRILAAYLADRPHAQVSMGDGYAALARELPPPSRRGALLIDPPYEMKTDYARVVAAVREALQRFATGTLMVWHPVVQLVEAAELPRRLTAAAKSAPKGWLHAVLHVDAPSTGGYGMTGSGMFVINPPHRLKDELVEVLPVLVSLLGQGPRARHELTHGGDA